MTTATAETTTEQGLADRDEVLNRMARRLENKSIQAMILRAVLADPDGTVTANDVRDEAYETHPLMNGKAIGGAFSSLKWAEVLEMTGRRLRSSERAAHGRPVEVWRLRDAVKAQALLLKLTGGR